jgi:hypothetical protein
MNSSEGSAPLIAAGAAQLRAPPVEAGAVETLSARALLLGERFDTRLERNGSLGTAPLTINLSGGAIAVLFRYGAVVLFGPKSAAMDDFVKGLTPSVVGAFPVPERDEVLLVAKPKSEQHIDPSGNIILRDRSSACSLSPISSPRAWCCRITRRGSPNFSIASSPWP